MDNLLGILGRGGFFVCIGLGAAGCIGPSQPLALEDEDVGSAGVGSLQVATVTRGQNHDADGYLVFLDEGRSETLPANGSTTFEQLRAGEWQVTIDGIAQNCTLQGPRTQTATVFANSTSNFAFFVDCV